MLFNSIKDTQSNKAHARVLHGVRGWEGKCVYTIKHQAGVHQHARRKCSCLGWVCIHCLVCASIHWSVEFCVRWFQIIWRQWFGRVSMEMWAYFAPRTSVCLLRWYKFKIGMNVPFIITLRFRRTFRRMRNNRFSSHSQTDCTHIAHNHSGSLSLAVRILHVPVSILIRLKFGQIPFSRIY